MAIKISEMTLADLPLVGDEEIEVAVPGDPYLTRKVAIADILDMFSGMDNPMTALGDLIAGAADGAPARLPVGSNGQVLSVVAGAPAWSAPPAAAINVQSVASAASVTPTFSNDAVEVTAQAAALTINNPTGTAINRHGLVLYIRDNGTTRALTWDSQWRAASGVTLPTATTPNKWHFIVASFCNADTAWDVHSVGVQA
ncbi:MAG: hypothetical protein KF863_21405 [Rubrivivax sp.]|nr:hypothetical protein [Rubrivivax sp.]